MQGQGCWDCVETRFTEPDSNIVATMYAAQRNKLEELKQKEGKAKSCILVSLDDSIFPKKQGSQNLIQILLQLCLMLKETN